MVPVQLVLHRLSWSNETVQNVPKHGFWVQWSGSGASLRKDLTQLHLANMCVMALVRPVLQGFSCSNETVRNATNMSFGSNGVDRVRSLQKILT
jgi:hypothetical protein